MKNIMKILAKSRARKINGSRRGISTIMANLTMLIIVVALASMLFIWAISSFGAYQGGAGYWFSSRSIANQERPSVENVFFAKGSSNCGGASYCMTLYVRNVGTIPFTISSIYLNSSVYNIVLSPVLVSQVQTIQFNLVSQSWIKGDVQTITIATQRGTVIQTTWVP
jgi:hypothetical protein